VLEKLATMQMIDVELPTTDDRVVVLSRYTEPEKDQLLLLRQLKLQLPRSAAAENHGPEQPRTRVSATPCIYYGAGGEGVALSALCNNSVERPCCNRTISADPSPP